tara:strand:- start:2538 stop:3716 length:1179 start_codon:yes stop_codon:yes gene_type:complete
LKILYLSLYYHPDLSAGSFRSTALIKKLINLSDDNLHIDLITTAPNRYSSYSPNFDIKGNQKKLTINRIIIPSHNSGIFDQAWSYIYFVKHAYMITRKKNYDLIFATSSRLMTAVLGAFFKKKFNAFLYLDIRDIFTDTIHDLFKNRIFLLILPIIRFLEKWSFKKADTINIVSKGFTSHILQFIELKDLRFFTNGIDSEFLVENYTKKEQDQNIPILLYAGNIGEGQGLHNILPDTAKRFEGKIDFHIIGDGGARYKLERELKNKNITNVKIFDPISRKNLISEYSKADILFLHLNDFPAFKKVLPSKIFEYAATKKFLIAGVGGYASDFIRSELPDVGLFNPCDNNAFNSLLEKFLNKEANAAHDRHHFFENYSREKIMTNMAKDILDSV